MGFVAVAVSAILVLRVADVVSDGVHDLFTRGWPALLVFCGLSLLLRDRIPAGGVAAVVLSAALSAGVIVLAYSVRSSKESDAQELPIAYKISASITLLAVNVETLATDVTITHALEPDSGIVGHFVGSAQSLIVINIDPNEETGIAEFTLEETKPGRLPRLEDVGRGRLVLDIPPDLPVAVAFTGADGDILLDLSALLLERLNVELRHGDAVIWLPEYQPQSPNAAEQPGRLVIGDGDLTVWAPETVDVRLVFDRRGNNTRPDFPTPSYIPVQVAPDGMLRRDQETAEIRFTYDVVIPHGLLSLKLMTEE